MKNMKHAILYIGCLTLLTLYWSCESNEMVSDSENITVGITLVNDSKVTSGEVVIVGKSHLGELLWSVTKQVKSSANTLMLNENAAYYSFTITANGVVKRLSLSRSNLKANPVLIIGMAESDYYKYTTSDGNVTVLFPKDPTNPYCEVKVIDATKIAYGYFSRSFWLNNQPVDDELYRSFLPDGVDNVTFKSFARFSGQHGATWSHSYGSIIYLSTENVYDDIAHTWEK